MDNSNTNELEENTDTNINSENVSSIESPKNLDNTEDKKPFFLMTLEDNLGKCQQIKIYQNSNPSELAFNFCKENNLDFSSMKYIKANIKAIIRKFNENQQKGLLYNNNNNSIKEEEDEDDYLTERTLKSNEKQKNKDNDEDNKLNEEERKKKGLNDNNNNSNEENDKNEIKSINNEDNNDENINKNIDNNDNDNDNDNDNEKGNRKDDEIDKNSKSIKSLDKENKNEVIKNFNNLGMMPLKINQISPKQIEINENIQKIIKINNSNSINSENDSINNFKSLKTDINNKQNFNNNTNNTTDRYSNSVQITIIDNKEIKEVKEISNSLQSKLKTKLSDIKQNKYIEQPFKSAEKKDLGKNKNLINENNNNELKNNFDLNNFGEKYINLNKNYVNQNNNNEFSNNLNQSEDSIESGVPVLHKEIENNNEKEKEKENTGNYLYNNNSEQTNYNSSSYQKEAIKKNDTKKKTNNNTNNGSNYMNKNGNNINKLMLLNKMKKLEYNIPKKNSTKSKQIDKLFNLIKNSYYNLTKNNNNKCNNSKITKEKNVVSNIIDPNKIKIKESNSIDINNELSKTYETEPNKNYPKEVINNPNIENSHKKINFINTNFNNYIENNKINHIKNNVSASNNEAHQMYLTNSINKQYFFSNPNLSSNQEVINKSNNIYCHKHNFKTNSKKKKYSTKSKSLGKDKNNKNRKINSLSKHKNQLSKKQNDNNIINNNKIKQKDLIKEKTKRCSLKFKNKYYLNNNSATPNINGEKKARYLNLQSCQTPPTKKPGNSNNYMNSMFSDWIMLTLGKGSRNIFSTRDTYFPKNRENNQTSKSVSELADTHKKKSNYRMLLSKSNFKNVKPNIIVKKIKYAMRNKKSMEKNNINNINNKNHHHNFLNSLKMINNSEAIWNKNNKNNFNLSNNNNETHNHVIHKKSTDKNIIMNNKKYLDRINYNNNIFNNNSMNTNNIINDYNFNNNNYYLSRLINNTINNFIYDSNENSKSGEKIRKIIQKQLTSPPKAMNCSKEFFGNKGRKKSSDKIIEYKTAMNKIGKMILNNSGPNQSYTTDNIPNNNQNININNLININNYQKNKNYNFNYDCNSTNAAGQNVNGNNHYIKNSRLKKNKVGNNHKINDNNQYYNNNIDRSRKQIDFPNELTNYYLNTEIYKQSYTNTNLTYSNLMNNNRTLSIDFSTDDKMLDEILINIFNKIFIFFNKEKTNKITLLDAFYKAKINFFPRNIGKILNNMILILSKNYCKKKKASHASYNSLVNTTKNSIDSVIVIDKNDFINEMLYIYKYYLSNEHKKVIMSYKDNFNKINQDNFLDRSFCNIPKNNIKNEFASPKSLHIRTQYKNKTEIKNNGN